MKPGERIRLIKEAAESLASRPLHEIQLTLGEFGLQTYDPDSAWGGGIDYIMYCAQQMRESGDDNLVSLHEYLLGEDAAPRPGRVADGPWGDLPARVFLSHIHGERHFVGEIKRRLEGHYGIDAFVAHDDIDPSKQWREVIKAGLDTGHAFVAFLHDGYHASQWCDQETGWALSRGVPILPIRPVGFDRDGAKDGFLEEHQDICLDPERKAADRRRPRPDAQRAARLCEDHRPASSDHNRHDPDGCPDLPQARPDPDGCPALPQARPDHRVGLAACLHRARR